MGIGTSLGAFYLDDTKFHSGVEEVIKPKEGDSDMEVSPKTLDDREKFKPKVTQAGYWSGGEDPENHPEPYGLNPPERETPFPRPKLTDMIKSFGELTEKFKKGYEEGMTDDDSLKLALEMVPWALGAPPIAGKVATGIATDIAAKRATRQLMEDPALIRDLGAETTGGQQVSEAIAAMRRRHAEERQSLMPDQRLEYDRITDDYYIRQPNLNHPRHSTNPDALSDADFYTYGEYRGLGEMTPAQEERWARIDRHYDELIGTGTANPEVFRQVPLEREDRLRSYFTEGSSLNDKKFKESMSGKDLKFIQTPQEKAYGRHIFANENGVGELNVHYKPSTKTIRVHDISLIMKPNGEPIPALSYEAYEKGPQQFGGKATKEILRYLKEQYPEAEWITGYRVSGARAKTGSGSAEAKMWIGSGPRPRRNEPTRRTLEQMLREEDGIEGTINHRR